MSSKAELVEFFEMMLKRAKEGEFRFIAVGTIGSKNGTVATVAGMATDSEAVAVSDRIRDTIFAGVDQDTRLEGKSADH